MKIFASALNAASGRTSFLRNIALSSAERAWMLLSRFLVIALIARILGPEGQGVYMLAMSTVVVATLPFCGSELGNNYLGNRYRSEIRALFGNALLLSCSSAVVIGLGLLLIFDLLADGIFSALPTTYRLWLPILAATVLCDSQLRGLAAGIGNYKVRIISTILGNSFFVGGMALAAFQEWLTVEVLIPLYLIGSVTSLLILLLILANDIGKVPTWDGKLLLSMLSYSFGASLYRGSNYLNCRFDIFVLAALVDTHALGLYGLGTTIVEAITYLPKGASDVIVTHTAYAECEAHEDERRTPIIRMYQVITVFIFISAAIVAAVSSWLVPFLFSREFVPAITPLLILLPGALGLALSRVAAHHIMGQGQVWLPWMVNLGCLGLLVVLNLILVPLCGIIGAASTFTSSYAWMAGIFVWIVARRLHISPFQMLAPGRNDVAVLGGQLKGVFLRVLSKAR